MLHSERKNYQKKISKLNKDFPPGFKTIDFRMLPDMIKYEIISNKILQMETPEFEEICSMLNSTPEDIQREKQQLEDYLDTLLIKMEDSPFKKEKDYDRIKKDSKAETTKDGIIYQTEDPLTHLDIEESLVVNSKTPLVVYPILFSWVGVMFLAISKSSIMFSYPLILNAITDITYFTYLVQLGIQSTQLIGLTWTNSMKTYSKKIATFVGLIFIIIFASAIAITKNIIFISILSACAGLFIGFIHGTSMKIMLEYGTAKDSTRYSTINEVIIGISFGFTPLIAGYVAEINIYSIFLFLAISGSCILILMVYLSRDIKKSKINKILN